MAAQRSIRLALALLCAAPLAVAGQSPLVQSLASSADIVISPARPTSVDHVKLHLVSIGLVSDLQNTARFDRSGNTFTLSSTVGPLSPRPPEGLFSADVDLGVLPSGTYKVVVENDAGTISKLFAVFVPPNVLSLDGGRFVVSLGRGTLSQGGGLFSPALQLSDLSGYFWFFDSENAEVTVKLLDGSAVNGHFWLFAATMTDQPFILQVIDTQCPACPPKLYINPAGKSLNFIDVDAFPK
jgi:hypothetical protein